MRRSLCAKTSKNVTVTSLKRGTSARMSGTLRQPSCTRTRSAPADALASTRGLKSARNGSGAGRICVPLHSTTNTRRGSATCGAASPTPPAPRSVSRIVSASRRSVPVLLCSSSVLNGVACCRSSGFPIVIICPQWSWSLSKCQNNQVSCGHLVTGSVAAAAFETTASVAKMVNVIWNVIIVVVVIIVAVFNDCRI